MYSVFIKYCVFSLKFLIFLNSANYPASLVFYLPSVCKHTDTEGKQRKARVRNILISSEKNTIFNEHPVVYFSNNSATKPYLSKKRIGYHSAKRPFFMTIITPYSHTRFFVNSQKFIHRQNDERPLTTPLVSNTWKFLSTWEVFVSHACVHVLAHTWCL